MSTHVFGLTVGTLADAQHAARVTDHTVTIVDDAAHVVAVVDKVGHVVIRQDRQ